MTEGLIVQYRYVSGKDTNEICDMELSWNEVVKEILLHASLALTKEEEIFGLRDINTKMSKYVSNKIDEERPMQKLLRGDTEVVLTDETIYKIVRYLVKNELVNGFYNERKEKVFGINNKGIEFLDNLIL